MLAALDDALLARLRSDDPDAVSVKAVRTFSLLGENGGVWLAIAGVGSLLEPQRRPQYAHAAKTVLAAFVVNQVVKQVVRRPRPAPQAQLAGTPTQLSYPSTHACTCFAGAGALSALLPAPALYALAVPLALSRLYLGVHYPSDTVAGAVLGASVAEFAR